MTEYEKNLDGLKRMGIALATSAVGRDRVMPFLTAAIESMEKQSRSTALAEEKQKLSDALYPQDDGDDEEIDCEVAFDHGRGQGIFEICNEVSKNLCPDN